MDAMSVMVNSIAVLFGTIFLDGKYHQVSYSILTYCLLNCCIKLHHTGNHAVDICILLILYMQLRSASGKPSPASDWYLSLNLTPTTILGQCRVIICNNHQLKPQYLLEHIARLIFHSHEFVWLQFSTSL